MPPEEANLSSYYDNSGRSSHMDNVGSASRPIHPVEETGNTTGNTRSQITATHETITRVMSQYTLKELVAKEDKTEEEKAVRRIVQSLLSTKNNLTRQLNDSRKTIEGLTRVREEQDRQTLARDQYILSLESRLAAVESLFMETGAILPEGFGGGDPQQSWSSSQGGDDLWTGDGSYANPDLTNQDHTQMDYERS
ncbi:hypothetical protein L198_06624 [Cryptococcus wingfieldii CBS 7118]|uniref:Uncharacterized protein n=1 Tax=Cryptococcus wingfieldii CBS 7118 TaxID=1295528 RepID=A0A1E3IJQ1_9TREE|nr:hypothetical protein L198_06624 [Cryptococcus wingfieldii CBS 7118]ODN88822.1 hypothetical protein L198_06624 [Cryptococcus wingfieldii CBS 7118]